MIDIKLTSGRDLDFSTGDFQVISGRAEIAQHLATRFRFQQGEWPLDTTVGIPTVSQIMAKPTRLALIRSIYTETILSTPGVISLQELTLDVDANRKLTMNFRAQGDDGNFVQGDETLIFGSAST